jgi:hypothetical protein
MKLKGKKWGGNKYPPPKYKTGSNYRHLRNWINEKRNVS